MIYSNPSFETEKHTHAFGAMLWWVVSLISMFTVGTGVTAIGLCGASVFKITSTFLQDNTAIVLMMFFAAAIVIFFICLLRFASVLTTSYKFDGNTIIKGTLAARGGLISKITANTDFEFVRANFDTGRYKKTIYENAVLTGETKRYLKYSSNGRTIKILKIYDSMPDLRIAENTVKKSVASRIIKRVVLVFAIFLALEITDLCIGYGKNDEVNGNISQSNATVEKILTENGYTMQKISNIVYLYTKSTADNSRTSKLRIVYDKSGNIDKSEVEMFIESENDILALESLLKVFCKSQSTDEFISDVRKQLDGESANAKLTLDNGQVLRLGTSGGYTEVHMPQGLSHLFSNFCRRLRLSFLICSVFALSGTYIPLSERVITSPSLTKGDSLSLSNIICFSSSKTTALSSSNLSTISIVFSYFKYRL